MQVSRFLKVLIVLSALMLLVPVAAAADPGVAKERPFKVEFSGPFEIDYPASWCSAETVGVTMTFTDGHGTHLGRIAGTARHCTNMTTGEITNGSGYLEAANGDKLNVTYDGWGAPTADPFVWDISCAFEYAGGSGRFANADGYAAGATKAFFLGPDYGIVEGTNVGALSYDASDRSN
ncbi:MAG: hypothetical protein U9N79_07700 [Actinomycetota bacterium]|nr:hypothetical protein [Actinomycetota bacterium]